MVAHVFSPIRDSDSDSDNGRGRGREIYVSLQPVWSTYRGNIAKASQCCSKTLSKNKTKTNKNKLPEV